MSALPTSEDLRLQPHPRLQCHPKCLPSRTTTWSQKMSPSTSHTGPCRRRKRHRYHPNHRAQRLEEQEEETIDDQGNAP